MKVIIKDVISPRVIIHPKSITGLIPLNTSDKKANIVVKTVYNIGQNILLVVFFIISNFESPGFSFLNCKNLVLV